MRTFVVLNPVAGGAVEAEALAEAVLRRRGWSVGATTDAGQARELAAKAVDDGYERIVAAGGDGTINEVVQGMIGGIDRVRFGIIPLGTANDFARTLDLPEEPLAAIELIEHGGDRRIDLIRVETEGTVHHCVNVAAGGFSGEVDRVLDSGDLKQAWGPLAYVVAAVEAAREMKAYDAVLHIDDDTVEEVPTLAAIVANGRTCAGGLRVAPDADPEDGLLDLVILRHGSVFELTGLAARLAAGTILESPHVLHRRVRRVHIASDPPMWFNIDGELLTQEAVTFTVVPRALCVTVGPEYRRDRVS